MAKNRRIKLNNKKRNITAYTGAQLPQKAAEVKQVIKNFDTANIMPSNGDYLKEVLLRLSDLQAQLENAERSLFQSVAAFGHYAGGTLQESFAKLQAKMDELNQNTGFKNMTNNVELWKKDATGTSVRERFYEKAIESLNASHNYLIDISKITDTVLIDENKDQIVEALTSVIENSEGNTKRKTKTKGNAKKLIEDLIGTSTITIQGNKILRIDTTSSSIPQKELYSWKKVLQEDYNIILKKEKTEPTALKEYLKETIINEPCGSTIWPYVEYELTKKFSGYDLAPNQNVIIGMLGEVKANAFVNCILGRNDAEATGNIRSLASGQEIPVDMVLRGWGFQVKNFRMTNGNVKFNKTQRISMGTFIDSRMRPGDTVKELLKEFFGSYQFNQPVKKAEADYTLEDYKLLYANFRERINGSSMRFLFNSYIDNILKISFPFERTTDEIYNMFGLQFNTIFFINDRIVPASAMVEALIHDLSMYAKATIDNSLITSSYSIGIPNKNQDRWQSPIGEKAEDIAYTNAQIDRNKALNNIKIGYTYTFDLSRVLNTFYKQTYKL